MRLNIYHHELPYMAKRNEIVEKLVEDTRNTFYGVRFYTEPPFEHEPGDDDSAAITLWVPWTKRGGHDTADLRIIAMRLLKACDEIERHTTGVENV